jgi:hypothetical protein
LSGCIGAQEKRTELLDVLGEDTPPGGHRVSVQTGIEERRELFEFCILKKNPLGDLHRVVEHPDRLSKRLLEQRDSQEGIQVFSICGRRKLKIKSLRGLSI